MKTTVVFRDEAITEVAEAVAWYEEQRAGLGVDFIHSLDEKIGKISHYPESYPIVYREARMTPLHRFPYLVIYSYIEDVVYVVAVMHGKRNSGRWKTRVTKK